MAEENKQSETSNRNDEGNKSEASSLITEADRAAERLERVKEELKKENDRRENILARERLGGKTLSAPAQETQDKEDPRDYAQRALRGEINK